VDLRRQRHALQDWAAPGFFARLDYAIGRNRGSPMNGQAGRQAMATEIIRTCGIELIVETGSYRGATTEWLASFGVPVRSVEIRPTHGHYVALRLAGHRNVQLSIGDSVGFLDDLSKTEAVRMAAFFYLDAHWEARLPLADELKTIARSFPDAVAMIDDFEVPDDAGYGFDDYGRGRRLDLDYLRESLPGAVVCFPRLPSAEETGARRGCAVVPFGETMRRRLAEVTRLRVYDGVDR
jgi:hypothetical protein